MLILQSAVPLSVPASQVNPIISINPLSLRCYSQVCTVPEVTNGAAIPSLPESGEVVTLRCNSGYKPSGTTRSTCEGGAAVSLGTCVSVLASCQLPILENGWLEGGQLEELESGKTATLECDPGFHPTSSHTR